MALPPDVHVFVSDDAHLAALWHDVYVTAWWGDTTVARLRGVDAYQREVLRRRPAGFVALALLSSSKVGMSAEVRAEAERVSRESPPQLRAIAQVIHGTGFAAAAIRSVATGITMLSTRGRAVKIFDTLEPAAAWLAPRANALLAPASHVTPDTMVRTMRELLSTSASVTTPW